ncbi:hypothetical protein EHS25_005017 [Saitozyma podzolica]|uniref:NADH:ubiquinone oxidoreductase intermediate-associated protein 30 domain-containing protein n=1 Tax=Saitozyma podzolica TaxID=1890683 RepID=A0A427Y2A6_9TREE|nr:hypothetical protein EHS25_005017 [Saitozyma podzolica]
MSASPLKQYLDRSLNMLRRNTAKVVRMDVSPLPPPHTIFSFSSERPPVTSVKAFATGSDADIGGLSTCTLTSVPKFATAPPVPGSGESAPEQSEQSHLAFHGNLSLTLPPAYQGRIRTGYAAFRNRSRPSLFGEETWDLSLYSHLKVELRLVSTPSSSVPFIHLDALPHAFRPTPHPPPIFETLHIPFAAFVLTNSGVPATKQIPMMSEKIRTLGFALLGGGRQENTPPPGVIGEDKKRAGAGVGKARESEDAAHERPIDIESLQGATLQAKELSDLHKSADEIAAGAGGGEGYFELCIKSVEAVRWKPEAEDADGVDPEYKDAM